MPTQTEDGFVTSNGLQIHYRRWSSLAANPALPPILLLHGLASSSQIWNLVAPQLNRFGYTVTALDQRGHGESEKPDSGYDFTTILADDGAVIDALKIERPVLVGHDIPLQRPAELAELIANVGARPRPAIPRKMD